MALSFALLGDSIAYGQGASRPADTLAARLTDRLVAGGHPTDVRVFAVPGARSQDLATQVTRAAAWEPDLALIVIGANDLTRLVPPEIAAAQLGAACRALREAAVEVVVAPAPDLSVVPWVPVPLRPTVRAASLALQEAQIRATRAAGATVADGALDTSANFAIDESLFSADRFHPSSAGYARIAGALTPAIRAAARAAELSSG